MKKLLFVVLGMLMLVSCNETRDDKIRKVCETEIKKNLHFKQSYKFKEMSVDTCAYNYFYMFETSRNIIDFLDTYKTYFQDFERGEELEFLKDEMEYKIAVNKLKECKMQLDVCKNTIKSNILDYENKDDILMVIFSYFYSDNFNNEDQILFFIDMNSFEILGYCDLITAMKIQGHNESVNKYLYILINYFDYKPEEV